MPETITLGSWSWQLTVALTEALTLSMTTTVLDGLIACYNNWPCLQWPEPDAVNGGCAACAPGSAHCGREWEGGSISTAVGWRP
eukprot:scaffold469_cov142-Isochrysis_galbana.AAC.2